VSASGIVCVVNRATRYGSPAFEILIQPMQQLDLLSADGPGHEMAHSRSPTAGGVRTRLL
jgi:hypothetical protein